MNIRKLRTGDAPLMLEWMHDDFVVHDMKTNFASKTLEDCISFINDAQVAKDSLHMAVTDDNDIYMGTVSLKHIKNSSAEFAITVRKCAMGKGYSQYGMRHIIETGFGQIGLEKIYWCVSPVNQRAVRFYDKNGYKRVSFPTEAKEFYAEEELQCFIWYEVQN